MKKLIVLPLMIGSLSALLAVVINPHTAIFRADETAVSYLFAFVGVVWGLVTVTVWTRIDEVWKACEMAIQKDDKESFYAQVEIEMDQMMDNVWKLFAFLCIASFHLFHFDSQVLLIVTHFLVATIVSLTVVFIKDRDTPLTGVVNLTTLKHWKK